MNKTLKTVLITMVMTIAALIILIMLFGEDTPAAPGASAQASASWSPSGREEPKEPPTATAEPEEQHSGEASEPPAAESGQPDSPSGLSDEEYSQVLGYDVFDWNGADDKGKIEIARKIIKVWEEAGAYHQRNAQELAEYIDLNISDQANMFETACIAEQIDPLPYFEKLN